MRKGSKIDIVDLRKEIREGNLKVFMRTRKRLDQGDLVTRNEVYIEDVLSEECIRIWKEEVVE